MKHALVVRHVVHEGLAGYRAPIEQAGYKIQRVAACQTDFAALDLVSPDLLVVMGGPMGVYDTEDHPWITDEIAAITARLAADRPTLGVCLGSQMLAAALGASVYAGPVREVGFAPMTLSEAALGSPLRHVADVDVLHWHGDTFDLPEGTELLASTPAYAHQAFRRGDRLLALQFHAEMGEDPRFQAWMDDKDYISAAGVDPAELQEDHDRLGPSAVRAGERMIADWLTRLDSIQR
ncbi:MAG: glutamine amidotransferase [Sphingomonas sp.]